MKFTKMSGTGKDFIFVDCFTERPPRNPHGLAVEVSDRHRGVGAEELILIEPSNVADVRVRSYAASGDETHACGNGLRCVAKYLFDHKLCTKTKIQIEAETGVLNVDVFPDREIAQLVKVELGSPEFDPIPIGLAGNPNFDGRLIDVPLAIEDFELPVSCLALSPAPIDPVLASQLNPLTKPLLHCLVFLKELSDDVVCQLGPLLETSEDLPEFIQIQFVEVKNAHTIRLRTWIPESGEVISSGMGAGAACVAGVISGRTDRSVECQMAGGVLHVEWDDRDNRVHLTGSAVEVFSGRWNGLS